MGMNLLELAQIMAMVMASGTPAVTYYVMMRQDRLRVEQQRIHCAACRSHIDEVLDDNKKTIRALDEKQVTLRQETLPERYTTKREHDDCRKERRETEVLIFSRLNSLANGKGGK